MNVIMIDHNAQGMETMIASLGICRGNDCTLKTLEGALVAKPVPHMSVLEFGWACLKVEGVSVKTRLQVLRSRMFSTMERSTRAIDMSEAECITPKTTMLYPKYDRAYVKAFNEYESLIKIDSLEDASYMLPLATETEFFLAGNIRVWYEYFQKRLCKKHVQDEHYRLALRMWQVLCLAFPILHSAHPCDDCGACKVVTK